MNLKTTCMISNALNKLEDIRDTLEWELSSEDSYEPDCVDASLLGFCIIVALCDKFGKEYFSEEEIDLIEETHKLCAVALEK